MYAGSGIPTSHRGRIIDYPELNTTGTTGIMEPKPWLQTGPANIPTL